MKINEIININIETKIAESIQKNLIDIKLFFIAFAINIVIFGHKIFFYSMTADDYFRYNSHGSDLFFTKATGRWAIDLLNEYVFVGFLHILPYFHGIIGVFTFTLVGYLTAKYWKRTNKLEILIVTLLISASPMFAHNLSFNTNITVWLASSLGIIGFLMLYRSNVITKLFGFTFMVIAIGSYQTNIQVIAAMILFKSMLDLLQVKSIKGIKNILLYALLSVLFVALAYSVSLGINEYILQYYNLAEGARYKTTETFTGISVYIDRITSMYKDIVPLNYFGTQLFIMYKIMGILSILGIVFSMLQNKTSLNVKFASFILMILLFLSIPIVINLPLITGIEEFNLQIARAHYTIGWVLAGLFTIQIFSFKGIFKTLSTLLAISIIIVSAYYINIFFDAASRQTSSDILRANTIVERIRTHENYLKEPMKFKIVGMKSFPTINWTNQQAFSSIYSRYAIFQYYTDFKFTALTSKKSFITGLSDTLITGMTDNEYREIIAYLIEKGERVNAYPGKNSIVVYKDKAVLFLQSDGVNNKIKSTRRSQTIAQDRKPDVESNFNIYIEDKTIYYKKSPCIKEDTKHFFFVQIYPVDKTNIPKKWQKRGYDRRGFSFGSYGEIVDNTCTAIRKLPAYDILKLRTGQILNSERDWEVTYSFEHNNTY